jgi:hypothetical protein
MATIKQLLYIPVVVTAIFACLLETSPGHSGQSLKGRADDKTKFSTEQTIFLPWTQPFSRAPSYRPSVLVSISGWRYTVPVDTSSTGFVIGSTLLPNVELSTQDPKGWEFQERSNILFSGQFVNLYITFYGANTTQQATSLITVLVVTKITKCPGYDILNDAGVCPSTKIDSTYTQDLGSVLNMGIGFGLDTPSSGLPFGTPSHNPFLNIISMDGDTPVSLRIGYTISTAGISLGLTSNNTAGAAWTQLERINPSIDADPRAWMLPAVSFKINNGDYEVRAHALVDTSIAHMEIQAIPYQPSPNSTLSQPQSSTVRRVKNGTHLTFAFPDFENGVAGYDFVVGDTGFPSQPTYVEPVNSLRGPYVNTGRNLLWGFTIVYDAVGGRFGIVCLKCV